MFGVLMNCTDKDRHMADYVMACRDRLAEVSDEKLQMGTIDLVVVLALQDGYHD